MTSTKLLLYRKREVLETEKMKEYRRLGLTDSSTLDVITERSKNSKGLYVIKKTQNQNQWTYLIDKE